MSSSNKVWTPANIVTICRIGLIPLFVILLMTPWATLFGLNPLNANPVSACICFILLCVTDFADGYLARSRNEVTTLGKFMDPLADKILVCAAFLCLIELGSVPNWIALIVIAREFIISGLRMMAASDGLVIAASWYGKWKTAVTMVALVVFVLKEAAFVQALPFFPVIDIIAWVLMVAAVILTIVSMVDYFVNAEKVLHLFTPAKED